jgi:hypothetical protein
LSGLVELLASEDTFGAEFEIFADLPVLVPELVAFILRAGKLGLQLGNVGIRWRARLCRRLQFGCCTKGRLPRL